MKLSIYNVIVLGSDNCNSVYATPFMYWTNYGSTQKSTNEWFYVGIESFYMDIYFYNHSSGSLITFSNIFTSFFSLDVYESTQCYNDTSAYLWSPTYISYYSSFTTKYGVGYGDMFSNQNGAGGSYEAGTTLAAGYSIKNTNVIHMRLAWLVPQSSTTSASATYPNVGYHITFKTAVATVPDAPVKTVSSTTARSR